MKTAKLVTGIISIVLCGIVMLQSCAAGVANTLEANGEVGGSAGLLVSVCLLIAGIVTIATRKSIGKGGSIAATIFYALGALFGFTGAGSYSDLNFWSGLCVAFAIMHIVSVVKSGKAAKPDEKTNA